MRFYTEASKPGSTVMQRILTGGSYQSGSETVRASANSSRATRSYVKRQGRWQVVASHLSNDDREKSQIRWTSDLAIGVVPIRNINLRLQERK